VYTSETVNVCRWCIQVRLWMFARWCIQVRLWMFARWCIQVRLWMFALVYTSETVNVCPLFQASSLSLKPQVDNSVDLAIEIENLAKLRMVRHWLWQKSGTSKHCIALYFVAVKKLVFKEAQMYETYVLSHLCLIITVNTM